MDVPGRLGRLRELLDGAGCDALLVSNLVNVRYLTGFSGSAGMLFVGAAEATLVTDGRYAAAAPAEIAGAGAAVRVEALRSAGEQAALLGDLATGLSRVGLEAEDISWARKQRFSAGWAKGIDLVATTSLVEGLRQRKDAGEVARATAACAIADAALARVLPMLAAGPSEFDLAMALEAEMRRLGSEGPAFATIVASGPNAAEPHHRPGERRAALGELVVFDFGAKVDGYCSDMTRTVRFGAEVGAELAPELRRAVSVVLASQDAGLCAVREGVPAAEVDRACREVIEAAGWGALFVHGTGHGVGLDIHEAPALGAASQDILCSGQVVTVEPGVYFPGLGGVRTEDTVVVTEAGCEVMTLAPKQTDVPYRISD
jgi:Xaa-Pro aminopeptidase